MPPTNSDHICGLRTLESEDMALAHPWMRPPAPKALPASIHPKALPARGATAHSTAELANDLLGADGGSTQGQGSKWGLSHVYQSEIVHVATPITVGSNAKTARSKRGASWC